MKRYCIDTSGLSHPWVELPADIHETLWGRVIAFIETGALATTTEIYEEMLHIPGALGQCIKDNKDKLVLEINNDDWDWQKYVQHSARMNVAYRQYICEYMKLKPRKTVGLSDMSVCALGKSLELSVVNMEKSCSESPLHRKIPDICIAEGIAPMDFNALLRAEGIKA